MKRVVITGMGTVSPLGYGISALMEGLDSGKSAVRFLEGWDRLKGLKCLVGAPVALRDEKNIPRVFRRSMNKMSIMAVQACDEALNMAGLGKDLLGNGRIGCVMGSTTGSPEAIASAFEKILAGSIHELNSMAFFKTLSHTISANVAQYLGLTGMVISACAACASSLQSLCLGSDLIRFGKQDIMICGGAEELHPVTIGSFDILEATSIRYQNTPEKTPRPFDQDRDGLVCGEGAGVLVLEEYEYAKKRGAEILAEIAGTFTNTSNVPVTQSDAPSLGLCMKGALEDSGLSPEDIDYVNAHGTGTLHGDSAEAAAIHSVFGGKVPVSSLKGYMGHTLGASGAIESAASLMMLKKGVLYPGLNLDKPAEDCSIISLLLRKERKTVRNVLKNSFAFGGINASIIFRSLSQ